jgi:predicted enzyme related to lactoylglutathione lyase
VIIHVKFVAVPTTDQDRALTFYTEKLGFKVVTDQPFDGTQRWIELRIGTADTRLVLFNMGGQAPGASFNGALACDNVQKTYETLVARGVEFSAPPTDAAWGSFAVMKDPDGNQIVLSSR